MGGNSNKVIARELDVCEATVKVHVKAILRKLEVNNRTQAAMWASARGLAQPHSAVPEDAMVKKAS
jgi:two-component system nitrate/nitrite response regulator NarL